MFLFELKNKTSRRKNVKRVGRGPGSGMGKTCGRGYNGCGSRSGYKRRHGYEGGQFRLYMKLPCKGFSNARFAKKYHSINLDQINFIFQDGEIVNEKSLREHGFLSGEVYGIKVLGNGELSKKVKIEANAFSKKAEEKLKKNSIKFEIVGK